MNEKVVNWISDISEREMNEVEATETLLKVISNEKTKKEQLNAIQHILMYACAHYLCNAKRNGMALNSVGKHDFIDKH